MNKSNNLHPVVQLAAYVGASLNYTKEGKVKNEKQLTKLPYNTVVWHNYLANLPAGICLFEVERVIDQTVLKVVPVTGEVLNLEEATIDKDTEMYKAVVDSLNKAVERAKGVSEEKTNNNGDNAALQSQLKAAESKNEQLEVQMKALQKQMAKLLKANKASAIDTPEAVDGIGENLETDTPEALKALRKEYKETLGKMPAPQFKGSKLRAEIEKAKAAKEGDDIF